MADFNEYFSGFKSIGHNDWFTIFLFYGVMKYVQYPNRLPKSSVLILNSGLWVIFPAYMTVVFGSDILQALDDAAEVSEKEE